MIDPTPSMTPPPALTWLHLLPAGVRLECEGTSDDLADLVRDQSGTGEPVRVVSGDASCGDLAGIAGLVAINARSVDPRSLERAGFSYIRRFAVMPRLRNPRWFVPLASPRVSSSAFSLYTPARLSARLKRWAVRTATATRLPIWYRDQLLIAVREPPPLEALVTKLFPVPVRVALSSGAPEGARNRKASAVVIDFSGKVLGFIKLARSDIARRIASSEAAALPKLSHLHAPRLLFHGEVDGTQVLVQTPLEGRPAPLPLGQAHRAFLHSLQTRERSIASQTGMVRELARRLRELPIPQPRLLEIFDDMLAELEGFTVPVTIVHGDFAPWNLRLHDGQIAAFDWEYAEFSGLPLIDEIHYRLQVGWLLDNWTVDRAAAELRRIGGSGQSGLRPTQVRAIAVTYLLDALARLLGEGYSDEHEMIVWHRRLLEQVALATPAHRTEVAAA